MTKNRTRAVTAALCVVALAALGFAGPAAAKLTGNYTKFAQCPFTNAEARKCIYAVTESGEVILGKKTVPIEKSVVLKGAYTTPNEETNFSKFIAPTDGITLSKAAQNVPGGLAGIVPEKGGPALVTLLIKFFFENKLTGLTSTLELAKPASEISVSESHIAEEEGVGLKLPVMLHLENPFLGKKCYVGSTSSPITWNLTTGATAPPAPNKSIVGGGGASEFLEEGRIFVIKGTKLVDNAWAAPKASGCGGIISFLVNPIIDSQLGTTTAGNNTAILTNTLNLASAAAVKKNDAENP